MNTGAAELRNMKRLTMRMAGSAITKTVKMIIIILIIVDDG